MTATYAWDVLCTLEGYGTYDPYGDWSGYWSKQGPDLLERRSSTPSSAWRPAPPS